MPRTVTLGGDRLGAGKKNKVTLHGYERSTHDKGYLFRTTMSAGTLVPFLSQPSLPGDTWDINLGCDVKTHPTIGPLFGSYKVQLDVFEAPVRLYQGELHNNKLGIGLRMGNVLLPQIRLTGTPRMTTTEIPYDELDTSQINPSCLLAYLGIRGVGYIAGIEQERTRNFYGIPLLAYWDIYKNYYSNKQEEIGAVIYPDVIAINPGGTTGATIKQEGGAPGAYTIEGGGTGITYELKTGTVLAWQYAAGTAPIPNQIMILLDTGEQIPFSDIIIGEAEDTGLEVRGTYNYAKHGQNFTALWRWLRADEIQQKPPEVRTFDLSNIDTMREKILQVAGSPTVFVVNDQFLPGAVPIQPYNWLLEKQNGTLQYLGNQSGLALKTYNSDLLNNWLQTEWIDGAGGITEITSVDVSSGFLKLDSLNLAKKVYDMLNRIAVSGGTYDDWQISVYDHEPIMRAETPMYMGGLIKELVFQEVVSNSESQGPNGAQPLGTLAGKGVLAGKHKGGSITIKCQEIGHIIGLVSLTPRIDYSQGNEWYTHLRTMDDFHKPQLDEIGFQELITEQFAWWDTEITGVNTVVTKSAGKQPAWLNYMTDINKTYGNFAIKDNEMFMTLNRRYEAEGTGLNQVQIKDLTTYIDPVKYNNIFAETTLDAQNFWVQIAVDITVRRKMSAKLMPNL